MSDSGYGPPPPPPTGPWPAQQPGQGSPPQRRKLTDKTWPWIALAVAVAGVVGIAAVIGDETPEERAATETTAAASDTTEATQVATTEAPTTTAPPEPFPIDPGVYAVPDEIAPGIYRVGCYWARLDADQDIMDNEIVDDGVLVMTVRPTDAFVEFACRAAALADMPKIDPIAEGWTDGTYLVGTDIDPGQYRVKPIETGSYWARLDQAGEIIDNNLSDGQLIVVLQPDDWALNYSGTLEPMQ